MQSDGDYWAPILRTGIMYHAGRKAPDQESRCCSNGLQHLVCEVAFWR